MAQAFSVTQVGVGIGPVASRPPVPSGFDDLMFWVDPSTDILTMWDGAKWFTPGGNAFSYGPSINANSQTLAKSYNELTASTTAAVTLWATSNGAQIVANFSGVDVTVNPNAGSTSINGGSAGVGVILTNGSTSTFHPVSATDVRTQ